MASSDFDTTKRIIEDLQLDPKVKDLVHAAIEKEREERDSALSDPKIIIIHDGIDGVQPKLADQMNLSKYLALLTVKTTVTRPGVPPRKLKDFTVTLSSSILVTTDVSYVSRILLSPSEEEDFVSRIRNWLKHYSRLNIRPVDFTDLVSTFRYQSRNQLEVFPPAYPVFKVTVTTAGNQKKLSCRCTLMELMYLFLKKGSDYTDVWEYEVLHPYQMKIDTRGLNLDNWELETMFEPKQMKETYRKVAETIRKEIKPQAVPGKFWQLYSKFILPPEF